MSGLVDEHAAERFLADPAFRSTLDLLYDHVAIGRPVRDEAGTIVDFELVYVNAASLDAAGRSGGEMEGRRVSELYAGWLASDVGQAFCRVVETGEPYEDHWIAYEDTTLDGVEISGHWSISCTPFGDGYLAVTRDVSSVVRAELARREEQRELELTRTAVELLQRAALPLELPTLPGVGLAARHVPAAPDQPLGGDWYDLFPLDDDRLALVIADVAGHGRDAAAHMVQLRTMVRTLAVEHEAPDDVLRRANAVVARVGDRDLHATCAYAVLDASAGTLCWASAGHPPLIRVAGEATFLVAPTGLPLGVDPGAGYEAREVQLEAGDRVLAFTDGLVERRGEELGTSLERLRAVLAEAGTLGAADTVEAAVAARNESGDDVAVVCLELLAPERR